MAQAISKTVSLTLTLNCFGLLIEYRIVHGFVSVFPDIYPKLRQFPR